MAVESQHSHKMPNQGKQKDEMQFVLEEERRQNQRGSQEYNSNGARKGHPQPRIRSQKDVEHVYK